MLYEVITWRGNSKSKLDLQLRVQLRIFPENRSTGFPFHFVRTMAWQKTNRGKGIHFPLRIPQLTLHFKRADFFFRKTGLKQLVARHHKKQIRQAVNVAKDKRFHRITSYNVCYTKLLRRAGSPCLYRRSYETGRKYSGCQQKVSARTGVFSNWSRSVVS